MDSSLETTYLSQFSVRIDEYRNPCQYKCICSLIFPDIKSYCGYVGKYPCF